MADQNVPEEIPQAQELPEIEEIQPLGGFEHPHPPASNASSNANGGSSHSSSSNGIQQDPTAHWFVMLIGWLSTYLFAIMVLLLTGVRQSGSCPRFLSTR